MCWSLFLIKLRTCFKNTYFEEHLQTTASVFCLLSASVMEFVQATFLQHCVYFILILKSNISFYLETCKKISHPNSTACSRSITLIKKTLSGLLFLVFRTLSKIWYGDFCENSKWLNTVNFFDRVLNTRLITL